LGCHARSGSPVRHAAAISRARRSHPALPFNRFLVLSPANWYVAASGDVCSNQTVPTCTISRYVGTKNVFGKGDTIAGLQDLPTYQIKGMGALGEGLHPIELAARVRARLRTAVAGQKVMGPGAAGSVASSSDAPTRRGAEFMQSHKLLPALLIVLVPRLLRFGHIAKLLRYSATEPMVHIHRR
jgi:hypothetical protein